MFSSLFKIFISPTLSPQTAKKAARATTHKNFIFIIDQQEKNTTQLKVQSNLLSTKPPLKQNHFTYLSDFSELNHPLHSP